MNFPHTDGPYELHMQPGGGFIITADVMGLTTIICERHAEPGRSLEMEANGKLLTAAPKMLDTLRDAGNLLSALGSDITFIEEVIAEATK